MMEKQKEFEQKLRDKLSIEVRESQAKELLLPTFNKSAWAGGNPVSPATKVTTPVLKQVKSGFDTSVWQPPPVVQGKPSAIFSTTGFSSSLWKPKDAENSSQQDSTDLDSGKPTA
jgi:hypothetical protein